MIIHSPRPFRFIERIIRIPIHHREHHWEEKRRENEDFLQIFGTKIRPSCVLGLKNTPKVFHAFRKRRLKEIGICRPRIPDTEMPTTLRIRTDLTLVAFDYREQIMIGFWNERTLFENGSGQSEVRRWNLGKYFSPSWGIMLLYSGKLSSNGHDYGIEMGPDSLGLERWLKSHCW